MEITRFNLFTKMKSPKVMALPPTSANLLQHALHVHLQIMLWKAADQQASPAVSATITNFGWEVQNSIPVLVLTNDDPHPIVTVMENMTKYSENSHHTSS